MQDGMQDEIDGETPSEKTGEATSEKTAVAITGASSLIGRSLAALLVARGDRVVAFQRGEFSAEAVDADLVAPRRAAPR